MKFSKAGHVSLVSAAALILATAFTACSPVTIDYIFVAGNKANPGQIQTFRADRVSGALNPVGAAVSSGGVTPVSEAVSTDFQHLYVANQGDSTIVEFDISATGSLTSTKTVSMDAEGNTPVAIAMNAQGTLLYVANRFQAGCETATTGAELCNGGALAVFPVGSDGSLGSAVANGGLSYWPVGINPTAVNALASGTAAYVTSYDPGLGLGYIHAFSASSTGGLTSLGNPILAGVKPSSLVSTPTSRFVYVTDFSQNQIIAYSIIDSGSLHPLINGPFRTGNQPSSIAIDPRGIFLYVSNQLDNSISAYSVDLATGTPTAAVNTGGSAVNSTGTAPVALLVDPSYGRYLYSANFLDNSLTGFKLNTSTGTISSTTNGPYPTVGQAAALAAVPHGNHSIQINQP